MTGPASPSGAAASNRWSLLPDEMTSEMILRFTPDSAPVLRLVSRELRRLGEVFLRENAAEILSASNDPVSPLHTFISHSFVRTQMRIYPQTGCNDLEFLQSIPRRIRAWGATEAECPDRILLPEEVEALNRRSLDADLLRLWNSIHREISEAHPELEGMPVRAELGGEGSAAAARLCREWMRSHPNMAQGATKLHLVMHGFRGVPMEIALLTGLRQLELPHNGLYLIPPGLFLNMPGLLHLDVSYAQLYSLPPHVFDGLHGLQTLELRENCLSALAPDLFHGLPQLEKLELQHNQLAALSPNQFHGLGRLRQLRLGNNKLGTLSPNLFEGLSGLINLEVSGNRFDVFAPHLFDGLILLETLEAENNRLEQLSPDLFHGLFCLKVLALKNNRLTTLSPGQFHELTRLQKLDLSCNYLRVLSADHFHGLSRLSTLSLDYNLLVLPPALWEELSRVRFLSTEGNPQPGLIFFNRPMPEEQEACFGFVDAFLRYACRSFLADFYQRAAGGHYLGHSFYRLPAAITQAIRNLVWIESGSPEHWGAGNIFQSRPVTEAALKRYVREMFEGLTQEQRNAVYGHVLEMARQDSGAEGIDFSDPRWGEHHAEDNVLRLIDAIQAVLGVGADASRTG